MGIGLEMMLRSRFLGCAIPTNFSIYRWPLMILAHENDHRRVFQMVPLQLCRSELVRWNVP